jgi:hypothetical protein
MTRHNVPGDGGWFELRDIRELTSDHQDQYMDFIAELREAKRSAAAAALAAENPAVMPDPDADIPVRLTRKDLGPVYALVESWVITDSSFGALPLPKPLPLLAANVLRNAMDGIFSALNGETPKENPGSASTSTATSTGTATAPPAPSEPAPSATVSG